MVKTNNHLLSPPPPKSPNKSVAITEMLQVLKLHFTKSYWEKRLTKQEFAMVF